MFRMLRKMEMLNCISKGGESVPAKDDFLSVKHTLSDSEVGTRMYMQFMYACKEKSITA